MARPGFTDHPKFTRLVTMLRAALPRARQHSARALAWGFVELLWNVAYQNGDPVIGDAATIETITGWDGEPGELVRMLLSCGREGQTGLLEDVGRGVYAVHDLFDHAPDYVRKRRSRELQRRAKGAQLALSGESFMSTGDRTLTSQCPVLTGQCLDADRSVSNTPAPAPAPAPSPEKIPKGKTPSGAARSAAGRRLSVNQLEIQAAEAYYRDHDLEPPPARQLVAMRTQAGGGEQLLACLRSLGAAHLRMGPDWVHACCIRWGKGRRGPDLVEGDSGAPAVNGNGAEGATHPSDEEDPFDAMERRDRERARQRAAGLHLPG